MVFVPVIVPQAEPSARAKDLARRFEDTIATFERQYPGTSRDDVRQAVRLAVAGTGRNLRAARLVMALVAGFIAVGVGLFASLNQRTGGLGGEDNPAMPWVILGVLAAVLGVLVAVRRRS